MLDEHNDKCRILYVRITVKILNFLNTEKCKFSKEEGRVVLTYLW
jgi:hypothetical protein